MQSQGADTVRVFHHHFTVLTALACQHDDSDIVVVILPALLQLRSVERLRFFAQYRRCIEIAGRIRTTRNRQVVAGHTRGRAVFIGIVQRVIDRETDILQRLIQIDYICTGGRCAAVCTTGGIHRLHNGVTKQRHMAVGGKRQGAVVITQQNRTFLLLQHRFIVGGLDQLLEIFRRIVTELAGVVVCILCRGVPGGYDTTGRCAQVRVQRTSVGDGALRTKQRYNHQHSRGRGQTAP